jgi:hypothetical protein
MKWMLAALGVAAAAPAVAADLRIVPPAGGVAVIERRVVPHAVGALVVERRIAVTRPHGRGPHRPHVPDLPYGGLGQAHAPDLPYGGLGRAHAPDLPYGGLAATGSAIRRIRSTVVSVKG